MARDPSAQVADLRTVAALDEARALAALARLRADIDNLRRTHAGLREEAAAARRAAGADPLSGHAAEQLCRWAEQRQMALNLKLAKLHMAQEEAAQRAQRAVGRGDALIQLAHRLAQQRHRLSESRRLAEGSAGVRVLPHLDE